MENKFVQWQVGGCVCVWSRVLKPSNTKEVNFGGEPHSCCCSGAGPAPHTRQLHTTVPPQLSRGCADRFHLPPELGNRAVQHLMTSPAAWAGPVHVSGVLILGLNTTARPLACTVLTFWYKVTIVQLHLKAVTSPCVIATYLHYNLLDLDTTWRLYPVLFVEDILILPGHLCFKKQEWARCSQRGNRQELKTVWGRRPKCHSTVCLSSSAGDENFLAKVVSKKLSKTTAFTQLSVSDKVDQEFNFKIKHLQANSLTMTDDHLSSYFYVMWLT